MDTMVMLGWVFCGHGSLLFVSFFSPHGLLFILSVYTSMDFLPSPIKILMGHNGL